MAHMEVRITGVPAINSNSLHWRRWNDDWNESCTCWL